METDPPIRLTVNGKAVALTSSPETPLLWALRDELGLTGTKYGCGIDACGACTVHVDGAAVHACSTPIGSISGRRVTTIEGLSPDGSHPLQRAWVELDVAQCGYCQPGQIMQAAAILARDPLPSAAAITGEMNGNLCRCATYPRIRSAVARAIELARAARP